LRGKLKHKELYRSDLIKVKSPPEIRAALDESGTVASLSVHSRDFVYCGW
jgi:hypothetical protein